MKLICDECGAKYSIADEKVRGKVFKIRCKKCQNVIVVRGTEQPSAEGGHALLHAGEGAPAPAVTPSPSEPEPIWYVVIGRDQVGPLTDADVEERLRRGEVTGESFVWQEGFSDWVPIATVDRFASTVQALAPSPTLTPEPMEPFAEGPAQTGPTAAFGEDAVAGLDAGGAGAAPFGLGSLGGLGGFEEDDEATSVVPGGPDLARAIAAEAAAAEAAAAAASAPVRAETEPQPDAPVPFSAPLEGASMFGGAVGGGAAAAAPEVFSSANAPQSQHDGMFASFDAPDDDDAPSPLGTVPEGMVGARKDNSVLFSLKNLQSLAMGEAEPAPAPSAGTQTDASGLIDVRSLASDVVAPGYSDLGGMDSPPMAPVPVAPLMIPMVRRRSNTPVLVAVIIAAAILITGALLGTMLLLRGGGGGQPEVKPDGETAVASTMVAGKDKADDEGAAEAKPAAGGKDEEEKVRGSKGKKRDKKRDRDHEAKTEAKHEDKPVEEGLASAAHRGASPSARREEAPRRTVRKPSSRPPAATGGGGTDPDLADLLGDLGGKKKTGGSSPPPAARRRERDKPPGRKPPPQASPAGGGKPASLKPAQVKDVVQKNKGKIKVCAGRDPSASGVLTISFQIESNGRVGSASVKSPDRLKTSPAGRCVVQAVKTFRFPAFSGKPLKINYPFKL